MEDNNINQENIDQNISQNSVQNAEKLKEISDIYNPQSSNGGENVVLVNRSPIEYYILAFQKYGQFSGRATRNEYWWFYLVNLAVTLLLAIIESVFSIPLTLLSTIYLGSPTEYGIMRVTKDFKYAKKQVYKKRKDF